MISFSSFPLPANLLIFVVAAAIVWYAGTKMESLADRIAGRTGLGHAFVGVLLLAAATSLPEVTTTITAILIGNMPMAVHNLLGSVVFNTLALAIADATSGRSALTHRSPSYELVLLGTGVVLLLAMVLLGGVVATASAGENSTLAWIARTRGAEALVVAAYFALLYTVRRGQNDPRWQPSTGAQDESDAATVSDDAETEHVNSETLRALALAFAVASGVVLAAAWALTQAGDAIAQQTGLGGGFVGFVFLALATSLPEISTTVAAARRGRSNMAIANIFGSSAFVLLLLGMLGLLVGSAAFAEVGSAAGLFEIGLGMIVTLAFLWGLLEHEDRSLLWLGWDSWIVVVLVVGGSWAIYALQ